MTDLAAFLLARVAEDEAAARDALSDRGRWTDAGAFVADQVDDGVWSADHRDVDGIGIHIYDEGGHNKEQASHIARWDPARVLAECDAKRRIVGIHVGIMQVVDFGPDYLICDECSVPYEGETWWPCPTLRLLALPFAGHPEYSAEWAL